MTSTEKQAVQWFADMDDNSAQQLYLKYESLIGSDRLVTDAIKAVIYTSETMFPPRKESAFNEDAIFNQLINISKAGAYDILVEQVGELKKENAKLREVLKATLDVAIQYGIHADHPTFLNANEAMKQTKFNKPSKTI